MPPSRSRSAPTRRRRTRRSRAFRNSPTTPTRRTRRRRAIRPRSPRSTRSSYLDAAPRTFAQTSGALRNMLAPVVANLALPALCGERARRVRRALAAVVGDLRPSQPVDPLAAAHAVLPPRPPDGAVAGVARGVRVDRWVTLLRSANAITNPLSCPRGGAHGALSPGDDAWPRRTRSR